MNRSVIIFLIITAALSFPFLLLITTKPPLEITLVLILLCSFAPLAAAILVSSFGENKRQTRSFWQRVRHWQVDLFWYAMALFVPAGFWVIALAHFILGGDLQAITPSRLLILPLILVGTLGNEAGWRGFVLPRLLTFVDPIPASLMLGLLGAAFYAPFFWHEPLTMALIITIGPILSITSTWLFLGSGESVPLSALFQATFITFGLVISPVSNNALILATALAGLWALFLVMRCGGCLLNIPADELTSIPSQSTKFQHSDQREQPGPNGLDVYGRLAVKQTANNLMKNP
jgi:uncharacterized protein